MSFTKVFKLIVKTIAYVNSGVVPRQKFQIHDKRHKICSHCSIMCTNKLHYTLIYYINLNSVNKLRSIKGIML